MSDIMEKLKKINDTIGSALKNAESKSGGSGNNYPDIQILLENNLRMRYSSND